jgi:hypothetical protein
VDTGRGLADEQRFADLAVRPPRGEKPENLDLAIIW